MLCAPRKSSGSKRQSIAFLQSAAVLLGSLHLVCSAQAVLIASAEWTVSEGTDRLEAPGHHSPGTNARFAHSRKTVEVPTTFPAAVSTTLDCAGAALQLQINSSFPAVIPDDANVTLVRCQLPCSHEGPEFRARAGCTDTPGVAWPRLLHSIFCVSSAATLSLEGCVSHCGVPDSRGQELPKQSKPLTDLLPASALGHTSTGGASTSQDALQYSHFQVSASPPPPGLSSVAGLRSRDLLQAPVQAPRSVIFSTPASPPPDNNDSFDSKDPGLAGPLAVGLSLGVLVLVGAMCYWRDLTCLLRPFGKCRDAPVELVGPPLNSEAQRSYSVRTESTAVTALHHATCAPAMDTVSTVDTRPLEAWASPQRVTNAPLGGSKTSIASMDACFSGARPQHMLERSTFGTSVAFSDSSQTTADGEDVFNRALLRLPSSASLRRPMLPDTRQELRSVPPSARSLASDAHFPASEPAPFGPVSFYALEGAEGNAPTRPNSTDTGGAAWGSHLLPPPASAERRVPLDAAGSPGFRSMEHRRDATNRGSKPQGVLKRVLTLGRQLEDEDVNKRRTEDRPLRTSSNALDFEFELGRATSMSGTLPSAMGGPVATLWSTVHSTRSDAGLRLDTPAAPQQSSTPSSRMQYTVSQRSQSATALGGAHTSSPTKSVAPRAISMDSAPPGRILQSSPSSGSTGTRGRNLRSVRQAQQELKEGMHDDDMQIRALLERGTFGAVYQGTLKGQEVAIKTILFECSGLQPELPLEATIAARLQHRNVVATLRSKVQAITSSRAQELDIYKAYLIQEFCIGGSLSSALERGYFRTHHLPQRWNPIISILKHICTGMAYIHSKDILHGDLNPSNVLLQFDASLHKDVVSALVRSSAVAKIGDFGVARSTSDQSHPYGLVPGVPVYMAPEARNTNQLHKHSDVYAFGVIMWELIMGTSVLSHKQKLRGTQGSSLPTVSTDAGSVASSVELSREDSFTALPAAVETPTGTQPTNHHTFPNIPSSVALTYTLLVKACLSDTPADRPTFTQILQILCDAEQEVASGSYIDSVGNVQASAALQGMPSNFSGSQAVCSDTWSGSIPVPLASGTSMLPDVQGFRSHASTGLHPNTPNLSESGQGGPEAADRDLGSSALEVADGVEVAVSGLSEAESTYLSPESGESSSQEREKTDSVVVDVVPGPQGSPSTLSHAVSHSLSGSLPAVPSGVLDMLEAAVPPAERTRSNTSALAQIPEDVGSVRSTESSPVPGTTSITGALEASTFLPRMNQPDSPQPQLMLNTPRDGSWSSGSMMASEAGSVEVTHSSPSTTYRSVGGSNISNELSIAITAHPLGSSALSLEPSLLSEPGEGSMMSARLAVPDPSEQQPDLDASAEAVRAWDELRTASFKWSRSEPDGGHTPLLQGWQQTAEYERDESGRSVSLMPPQTPTDRSTSGMQSHRSLGSKQQSMSMRGNPVLPAAVGSLLSTDPDADMARTREASVEVESEDDTSGLGQFGFGLPGLPPMTGSMLAGDSGPPVSSLSEAAGPHKGPDRRTSDEPRYAPQNQRSSISMPNE